ncbi:MULTISPECIES: hypothetical protein [Nostocales]|nr:MULTISPECIES: hypothetical protein [Nostocales]
MPINFNLSQIRTIVNVRWRETPAEGDRKTHLILTFSRAIRPLEI